MLLLDNKATPLIISKNKKRRRQNHTIIISTGVVVVRGYICIVILLDSRARPHIDEVVGVGSRSS